MTLAIDGSVLGTVAAATSLTVALTTANAGDVIVVFAACNGCFQTGPLATIDDTAGLTWTLRASTPVIEVGQGQWQSLLEWYAIAPAALAADQITVWQWTAEIITVVAFGVSGANTAAPFDANASLPATAGSGAVTVSTNGSQTLIFGAARLSPVSPGNMPAPWTTIETGDWAVAGYQIFSTPQSSLTIPLPSGGASNGTIGDAIVAGGAAEVGAARSAGTARSFAVAVLAGAMAAASAGGARGGMASGLAAIGLGGPPRGPKPILAVRGIFRKRWRRYRLSDISFGAPPHLPTASGAGGSRAVMAFLAGAAGAARAAAATTAHASGASGFEIGLGGPPRGPRPIIPVRGVFRRRWRRYRLSYSTTLGQNFATGSLASRSAALGRLRELSGIAVGPGGRIAGAAHAGSALAGEATLATRATSGAFAKLAGIFGALLPTGVAGKGAARASAQIEGHGSIAGRAVALEKAQAAVAGSAQAPGRGFARGIATATLRGAGTLSGRIAAGAVRGALVGTLGHLVIAALRAAAGGVGRIAGTARAAVGARAGVNGHARSIALGQIGIALAAGGAALGRLVGIPGVPAVGAARAVGALLGHARRATAGRITARTWGATTGVFGALAGGSVSRGARSAGTASGWSAGGPRPLGFDDGCWMLPPTAGLTMTALPAAGEDAGPYAGG